MGKDLKGKELGTGLSQRKDGVYQGRYIDRFQKRKCVYDSNLKNVKKKLNEAIAENNKCRSVKENITLNKWFEIWISIYKEHTVRPNTLREYDYIYNRHISPRLGYMNLMEIRKLDIQDLLNTLKTEGYGYERVNKVRIVLIDMFNRAIEDDYLIKNPAHGTRVNISKEENRKALTVEEQDEFFEYSVASIYDYAFNVHVRTGLRPGELFALTKDDIDLENNFIDVNKTLVYQKYLTDTCKTFHIEEPKTKSSYRKVPINSECRKYLLKQLELKQVLAENYSTECPYLFVTSVNTPINSQIYNDGIRWVIKQINLKRYKGDLFENFSGHSFRHTFATRCFEAGINPKVVQTYLGHATLQMTTDLYTHLMDNRLSFDIEKLCVSEPNKIVDFERKAV